MWCVRYWRHVCLLLYLIWANRADLQDLGGAGGPVCCDSWWSLCHKTFESKERRQSLCTVRASEAEIWTLRHQFRLQTRPNVLRRRQAVTWRMWATGTFIKLINQLLCRAIDKASSDATIAQHLHNEWDGVRAARLNLWSGADRRLNAARPRWNIA